MTRTRRHRRATTPRATTTATDERRRRPTAADPRGRRRGGPPRRRGPGGPDDGGAGRLAAAAGRRIGPVRSRSSLVIALFLLFSVGTRPVDRCPVVHERRVRFGLLDAAGRDRRPVRRRVRAGAVVLLGNLWLAGRLAPPSSGGRAAASGRSWIGSTRPPRPRTCDAAAARRSAVDRYGGGAGTATPSGPTLVFEAGDLPDLTPARRHGPRRDRALHRPDHRRLRVGRLGDGPAVGPPGAVLAGRRR